MRSHIPSVWEVTRAVRGLPRRSGRPDRRRAGRAGAVSHRAVPAAGTRITGLAGAAHSLARRAGPDPHGARRRLRTHRATQRPSPRAGQRDRRNARPCSRSPVWPVYWQDSLASPWPNADRDPLACPPGPGRLLRRRRRAAVRPPTAPLSRTAGAGLHGSAATAISRAVGGLAAVTGGAHTAAAPRRGVDGVR